MKSVLLGVAAIVLLTIDDGTKVPPSVAQIVSLTPDTIAEAILLADDDKAVHKFLALYQIQLHTGWGDGPLIGSFSTPFSRVVQSALAAHSRGETLRSENLSSSLVEPELHIVALSQPALSTTDDKAMATVQSVTLAPRGSRNPSEVIAAMAQMELNDGYKRVLGLKIERGGVVARFPLKSLTPGLEIRVAFDRIARAPSPSSMCRECAVPLNLAHIR